MIDFENSDLTTQKYTSVLPLYHKCIQYSLHSDIARTLNQFPSTNTVNPLGQEYYQYPNQIDPNSMVIICFNYADMESFSNARSHIGKYQPSFGSKSMLLGIETEIVDPNVKQEAMMCGYELMNVKITDVNSMDYLRVQLMNKSLEMEQHLVDSMMIQMSLNEIKSC